MIKLIIAGMGGRMGQRILALSRQDPEFQVIYGLESKDLSADIPTGSDVQQIKKADVIIDFSTPEASHGLVREVSRMGKAIVIGTTGFTPDQDNAIQKASKEIPIVKAPNMSLGVNVFFKIAEETARVLRNYEVQIIETHHVHKKDAPSGTALYAGALIEKASGRQVTYESIRQGEVVGDHRILFTGPGDRLELFHHAESRDTFAAGSLVAAKWVVKQKPGLYTMKHVLGL